MSKFVVADSSCLISLSRIGKLEILHDLFGGIIIPEAVYYEVVVRGAGRTGAEEVKKAKWIKKQKVQNAFISFIQVQYSLYFPFHKENIGVASLL